MPKYILKRIVGTIPTLIIVVTFVFFFVRLIPGDPARLVAGEQATQDDVEAVREELGLNKSIPTQYVTYVTGLFKRKSRNIPSHKAASYKGGCGKIRKYRSSGICHIAVEFGCGCALWCVVRNSQGKMAGLYRNDDCGLGYFAPLVLDRLFADYAVCGKTANSADNKRNEPEKSDYAVYYAWRRNCSRDRTIYKILHY